MRGGGAEMCRPQVITAGCADAFRGKLVPPRKLTAFLAAVLLALSTAAQQPARQPAQQDDPRQRIRTTVALVVVPVTVKSPAGLPVLDIRREEFRIFEDGVEQQIQLFSAEPFPLSVVVLIDNSLPLKTAEQVQKSARSIAAAFSEFDEVAIGTFDLFYEPVLDFTTDNDRIYDHLKRLELAGKFPGSASAPMTRPPRVDTSPPTGGVPAPGMRGGRLDKKLDDAIYTAGQMLRTRSRERRKIIFLISDGENARNNTNSYDDTLRVLLTADVSVYAIGVGGVVVGRPFNPLSRYARATGGDVFYAASLPELESRYASLAEQARNQYTLAYSPSGTDRSREYHSIEVRVRRPNLKLLAREGYFNPLAP
jgi:VWFA-related protein